MAWGYFEAILSRTRLSICGHLWALVLHDMHLFFSSHTAYGAFVWPFLDFFLSFLDPEVVSSTQVLSGYGDDARMKQASKQMCSPWPFLPIREGGREGRSRKGAADSQT